MFLRVAGNIIWKDWLSNARIIGLLIVGMCIPLFAPKLDDTKQMMQVVVVAAAFGYTFFVFTVERMRESLPLLLGLPVRPLDLVVAKYLSLYSMCLVTINVGGAFLHDLRILYLFNAEVLFLSTVFMAAIVIWDHPLAPSFPLFLLALAFQRDTVQKAVTPHLVPIATLALSITPVIAIASIVDFKRSSRP